MRGVLAAALWGLCMLALRFARPRLAGGCPGCVGAAALRWAEGYLLGLAALAAREALHLPAEFRAVLLWYGWPAGFHLLSHFAVWVSTLLAAWQLVQLRPHRARSPQSADLVVDLALLPPSIGLLALQCLRLLADEQERWRAAAAAAAVELWAAWALWSFQRLSLCPAAGTEAESAEQRPTGAGLKQFLALAAGLNGGEVLVCLVAQAQPHACDLLWVKETECQQVSQRLRDQAAGALWCSSAVALYSLARSEAALPERLRLRRRRLQFLGAQLIVAVATVQRLTLMAGATLSLWKEASALSAHAQLLCLEACGLAALHLRAYPGAELPEDAPLAASKAAGAQPSAPHATAYGKLREEAAEEAASAEGEPVVQRLPLPLPLTLPLSQGAAASRGPRVAVPRLPLPLPMEPAEGTMPHYSGTPSPSSSQTMDWPSGPPSSSRTANAASDRSRRAEALGAPPAHRGRGADNATGHCAGISSVDSV